MLIFVLVMNEGALKWSSCSKPIFLAICVLFESHWAETFNLCML